MVSSRFSIIPRVRSGCPRPRRAACEISQSGSAGASNPILSFRYAASRSGCRQCLRRKYESSKLQFIELIAGKRVKIASQHPMHSHARETVGVSVRVVGRTSVLGGLGAAAYSQLRQRRRLDAAVARISDIRKPTPHPRERTVHGQAAMSLSAPAKKPVPLVSSADTQDPASFLETCSANELEPLLPVFVFLTVVAQSNSSGHSLK